MISQDSRIVKLARETFKSNKAIAKEAENLIMNLERGNMNPGISTKNVARDILEFLFFLRQKFILFILSEPGECYNIQVLISIPDFK
ncbi:hypothetical protein ACM39_12930 [Chryseobacterium sp. FH2]|uniref:hypothetical protein n=1 Tax=Chryseobacterium sp. FH2 TaxID=1674291 RepID=UPI00065B05F7|nr:hypothetical protein [Chryseobacterium sp. FH2]KMQ67736.1 hypothetical protein ACM39_12930 [Chryseobacterium sp. FH2]